MQELLDSAVGHLEEAAQHLQVHPEVLEKLRFPKEVLTARLLIRMDNGSRRSFVAWRCRYDDTRGPTKGGIRYHPEATMEEVVTLAFWMTFKCAVAGIPYGGGKGAIKVDPHELSTAELERLSRAYVQAFATMIGPERDIPAPDVYTNAMVMGWMADEYSSLVGHPCPAVITGKPVALGGSLGREDATARGGFYVLNHLSDELGIGSGAKRAVVQGFGNAGVFIAELLHDAGWKIVAVSDTRGAVYCAEGLDPRKVLAAKRKGNSVTDYAREGGSQAHVIGPDELLALECELLVPAAYENLIHEGNASVVKARVVLELANGPVTPEADAILEANGTTVVPDILANAGGVTVSYFEWVQNRQGYPWLLEDIHERLQTIMTREGDAVWRIALAKKISMRTAAYVLGLDRLAAAIEAHGTEAHFSG